MMSGPELALAFKIAWRNDPRPLSLTLVTVKVRAFACANGKIPARSRARQALIESLLRYNDASRSGLRDHWKRQGAPSAKTGPNDIPTCRFRSLGTCGSERPRDGRRAPRAREGAL